MQQNVLVYVDHSYIINAKIQVLNVSEQLMKGTTVASASAENRTGYLAFLQT